MFQELDALPGEKFGLAAIANDLFSAYAKQDPTTGLLHLNQLGAGIVRRKALMGFTTDLPAEYVSQLVKSVRESGFPDEEVNQIALHLHTAATRYSANALKEIIDARHFDEVAQQELTWIYEGKIHPPPPTSAF